MLSYQHPQDPLLDTFLLRTRGPHRKVTMRVLHYGFTDLAVLTPEIGRHAPSVAETIESELPSGTLQSVASGRSAMRRVRKFLDSFFGTYLHRK